MKTIIVGYDETEPSKRANFLRLRLNIIQASDAKFFAPGVWAGNGDYSVWKKGEPCFAGLDLSSTDDLSALVLLNRSIALPKTPNSLVVSELSPEDVATVLCRATWSLAADLGMRTMTGRNRDKPWISFKSILGIRESDSSKKSSMSGETEGCSNGITWVFITIADFLLSLLCGTPSTRVVLETCWEISFVINERTGVLAVWL